MVGWICKSIVRVFLWWCDGWICFYVDVRGYYFRYIVG